VKFKAARFGRKLPAAPRRFAVHAAFERPAVPPGPGVPTKPRVVCGSELTKGHIMSSKKPTLIAYTVKERGDGQKAIWTRIGAAWPHGSGTGFTLQLETLPLDGRIVLTEPKDDDGGAP